MARRYDHKPKELKELAIDAGLKIIKNEGFKGFSTRRVATDIGYTVGTIYNIFGSYDDFILHINSRILDAWYEALKSEVESYKGNRLIHNLAKFYINYARDNYNEWLALFEDHMRENTKSPKWYKEKLARFFEIVEELLPPTQQNKNKTKLRAQVLWASIHGITILALSGKLDLTDTESPEKLANDLIDGYL